VRYLFDTHGLLWWWTGDPRLGAQARALLESGETIVFVSAASVWEIAIKTQSGKLTAIEDFRRDYEPLMQANGFRRLPATDTHALKAGFLEGEHRDPFDRLIAAQALIEDLTVITRDPEIAAFGCRTVW
jgi:PIN domain nuclease of toxin-antitoxin system